MRNSIKKAGFMTFEIAVYVLAVSLVGLLISTMMQRVNRGWNVVAVTVICTVTTSVCFLYCMAVIMLAVQLY